MPNTYLREARQARSTKPATVVSYRPSTPDDYRELCQLHRDAAHEARRRRLSARAWNVFAATSALYFAGEMLRAFVAGWL